MKKVLSLLAMALMIVGLTGCIDNPDDSKQKVYQLYPVISL
jgi:predicted small lipoprotein YifL